MTHICLARELSTTSMKSCHREGSRCRSLKKLISRYGAPNAEQVFIMGEFIRRMGQDRAAPEFSGRVGNLGRICARLPRRRSVQIDKRQSRREVNWGLYA